MSFTGREKQLIDIEIKRNNSKWPVDNNGADFGAMLLRDTDTLAIFEINEKDFEDRVMELSQ